MTEILLWACLVMMVVLSFLIGMLNRCFDRLFHFDEKLTRLEAELSRREARSESE